MLGVVTVFHVGAVEISEMDGNFDTGGVVGQRTDPIDILAGEFLIKKYLYPIFKLGMAVTSPSLQMSCNHTQERNVIPASIKVSGRPPLQAPTLPRGDARAHHREKITR